MTKIIYSDDSESTIVLSNSQAEKVMEKLEEIAQGNDKESIRLSRNLMSYTSQSVYGVGFSAEPVDSRAPIGVLGGKYYATPDESEKGKNILLQLDLDQVSKAIGDPSGSGLLEIYINKDDWGSNFEVPVRLLADPSKKVLSNHKKGKSIPTEDWLFEEDGYEEGLNGESWLGSLFNDDYSVTNPIYLYDPKFIGKAVPGKEVGEDFSGPFESLSEMIEEHTLFHEDHIARLGHYDTYIFGSSPIADGWLPLMSFAGPFSASDPTEDDFAVFYRKTDQSTFEYKALGHRWSH